MTNEDRNTPIGVVLAGGASRRLGRDKATLPWGPGTLVEHAVARLASLGLSVAVADRGRGAAPGALSLADGPGAGPAAGLLGAARAFRGRPLLALACDLPQVPVGLLAELLRLGLSGADLVWPVTSRGPEPLAAWYGPRALTELELRVARGEWALHPLAAGARLHTVELTGPELAAFGEPDHLFANVNTPADWAELAGC